MYVLRTLMAAACTATTLWIAVKEFTPALRGVITGSGCLLLGLIVLALVQCSAVKKAGA